MKHNSFSNSNFRVISQDKLTVKNQYGSINFTIYYRQIEITKIRLSQKSNVSDLLTAIKYKLSINKKFPVDRILFLQTLDCREVFDYSLQLPKFQLRNYTDNQKLRLVMREDIQSQEQISINDFSFKKCLGQGASSSVFLVRHKGDGRLYALKQIQKNYFVQFKRMEQVLRERKIMTQIIKDFPFVSKLYASFQSQRHLNFLLQFYPGGEMFFHLQRRRLTQAQAKLYFSQMVLTFQFLHRFQVIYRDLKPQNIMIDFNGHAKLSDFGLCKINLGKDDLTASYCGSIQYMAPQIKQSVGYNYSVDFYTLGAFLYEMVMGVPPYYNNQALFFHQDCDINYKALVRGLIEQEVQNRINNFRMIKSSKWLADVDWSLIMKAQMRMPFQVDSYQSYIHDQFKNIPIKAINYSQKYDKLFAFFNYIRLDSGNLDFTSCYSMVSSVKTVNSMRHSKQLKKSQSKNKKQKKQSKDKSWSNKSNNPRKQKNSKKSNSKQKIGSSSKNKFTKDQFNIYTKRTKESQRKNIGSPNKIIFNKKTTQLKQVKSASDLMKNILRKY